jgi:hypothetical protein
MAYQLDHGWQTEHERLTRIGATLDPVTIGYLETIGVTTRWRCLEVGAGAGSIATWLCHRVGAHGHVVATDLEVKFLTVLDSPNLEIRHHDILGAGTGERGVEGSVSWRQPQHQEKGAGEPGAKGYLGTMIQLGHNHPA